MIVALYSFFLFFSEPYMFNVLLDESVEGASDVDLEL